MIDWQVTECKNVYIWIFWGKRLGLGGMCIDEVGLNILTIVGPCMELFASLFCHKLLKTKKI